jgi:sugar/nucleoside kinase (ribokinase family)
MVVCVGYATLDTILAIPRHPEADDRVVASALEFAGGGAAATAAVALARLDVPVSFVGAIGDDDAGAVIREGLEREGVDVSELRVVPGARSPRSTILVEGANRTIISFPGTVLQPELSARARELCRAADWVHVDHAGYGAARTLDGVRLSIDGGNPVPDLDLRGVALYAPTERALEAVFPDARAALDAGADLVVVTRGGEGSYAVARDAEPIFAPAYPVDVVSTLGAGDVFHGALLAQLVSDVALPEALARANRCAALSCRALDGRSAIPTAQELWATA